MGTGRLEAFSDGVLAIIITIMVLEMKVPEGEDLSALRPLVPIFLAYFLSFAYLGIYWNNHHHLMQAASRVNGAILWANLHLLFWLSLIPVATDWMGESGFAAVPVAAYGIVMLAAGFAYFILSQALITHYGPGSVLATSLGADRKTVISIAVYAGAIALSLWQPIVSCLLYAAVAVMWLVPDQRIERAMAE